MQQAIRRETKKREDENKLSDILEESNKVSESPISLDRFEFNNTNISPKRQFKEMNEKKLKSFIETEYDDLKNQLNTSYQNKDIGQIINEVNFVHSYAQLFGFDYVAEKCGELLKILNSNTNIRIEENYFNAFLSMFECMHKECKAVVKDKSMLSGESLQKWINAATQKKVIPISPIEEKKNQNALTGQSQRSPGGYKVGVKAPNAGFTLNQIVAKNPQDEIYKKLYKVKFEGLFKKDFNKIQLNEEMEKILEPTVQEEVKGKKQMMKSKITVNNNEYKANNDYPFKQEKYTCLIF